MTLNERKFYDELQTKASILAISIFFVQSNLSFTGTDVINCGKNDGGSSQWNTSTHEQPNCYFPFVYNTIA